MDDMDGMDGMDNALRREPAPRCRPTAYSLQPTAYSLQPTAYSLHTAYGYILFEAVLALSLLSMSLIVIHNGLRQTILVREQARDYTHARFLLTNVMAKVELQPLLTQATDSGRFQGEFSRFRWKWKVSKVTIPPPPFPPNMPPELQKRFKLNVPYLTKIEATVSWTRQGQPYEAKVETLSNPEKLFIPPEEREAM